MIQKLCTELFVMSILWTCSKCDYPSNTFLKSQRMYTSASSVVTGSKVLATASSETSAFSNYYIPTIFILKAYSTAGYYLQSNTGSGSTEYSMLPENYEKAAMPPETITLTASESSLSNTEVANPSFVTQQQPNLFSTKALTPLFINPTVNVNINPVHSTSLNVTKTSHSEIPVEYSPFRESTNEFHLPTYYNEKESFMAHPYTSNLPQNMPKNCQIADKHNHMQKLNNTRIFDKIFYWSNKQVLPNLWTKVFPFLKNEF